MSNRIHSLAQQLTGKASVEECSLEEVRNIAQRYPYFAPAQFLLLQKLRETSSAESEIQQKKAILYFHDPLLFNSFISSEKFYKDETSTKQLNSPTPLHLAETIIEEEEIKRPADSHVQVDEAPVYRPESEETEDFKESLAKEKRKDETSFDELEIAIDLKRQEKGEEEPVATSLTAEARKPLQTISDNGSMSEQEESGNKIAKHLNKLTSNAEPAENSSSGLTFEPFHTVDYFASQGIKISQDELPKDKLGKQLKSFTEWLKTMKRLPATQVTEAGENIAEKKVENMATHSVTESNVVTEAMAEVWAKQGNKEKALDIYSKLSLLNPSKRAYFAAKIETLKLS